MKRACRTILMAALALPAVADDASYDDCILQHLRGAKLDLAAQLIKQACRDNHQSTGLTAAKKRAYNDCLLQHLQGVESTQAAMDIRAACGRKHK